MRLRPGSKHLADMLPRTRIADLQTRFYSTDRLVDQTLNICKYRRRCPSLARQKALRCKLLALRPSQSLLLG